MQRETDRITIKVPSSIANLGPGFDVFALALKTPYDIMTVELTKGNGIDLHITGIDSESIPKEHWLNTAGIVAKCFKEKFDLSTGITITIKKGIRPGFGLGSSGADAAAAAFALNILLDLDLTENELIELASQGELASSNASHADNVSASLLGGFTVVRSYTPIDVLSYQPPENLGVCIAIPDIQPSPKKTAAARKILPENVTLTQLTHNVGHASSLVYGMITKDISIIGKAMDDSVVEPLRAQYIPGYKNVKELALRQGASGVAICGAGPSIAAFFDIDKLSPKPIFESMARGFETVGITSKAIFTTSGIGAQVLDEISVTPNNSIAG
jgi:homoserine kinase